MTRIRITIVFALTAVAVLGLSTAHTCAADVNATYTTGTEVPVNSDDFTATGKTVNFTLNFAPAEGTQLTVVRNTGPGAIIGTFSNLAQGETVALSYRGVTYHFVANYHGGKGHDLVLLWTNDKKSSTAATLKKPDDKNGIALAAKPGKTPGSTNRPSLNPSSVSKTSTNVPKPNEPETGKPADDLDGALEYEFNMTKDPATGRIPEGIFEAERAQANAIVQRQRNLNLPDLGSYSFVGPNNLGGRTRALVYDVRYGVGGNLTIMAGGVSGGVFKSIDNGATWVRKSPTGQHFSCTSIAQDPRPGFQDIWYYAVGEASGNSASATGAFYLGNGVYKSTNNGETWARMPNSNPSVLEMFDANADAISKIVVNPTNGDVYIAAFAAIFRSPFPLDTWTSVLSGSLSNSTQVTDLVVTSAGLFYAGFAGTNSAGADGVWRSPTGLAGSWTRIAGAPIPAGWNANGAYGRVVLAIAPSSENLVYALYFSASSPPCETPIGEAELFRWNNTLATWTDLSINLPNETGCLSGNDPFAVQGGYDLVVAVKPDDPTTVFIGGTNIYRSTTSGTSWTRIGGYFTPMNYAIYPNSHPDIHSIVFQPLSPLIMLCGNDGGIQRTTNNLAVPVAWTQINLGYRTYQYYYVVNDPRPGNTKVMGGAQDNGTTRNELGVGSNFESVFGGDGVSVGLSDPTVTGAQFEYVGTQNGNIFRRNATDPPGSGVNIRPTPAPPSALFVTLFKLDPDNTQTLYYAAGNLLFLTTSASTVTPAWPSALTGVAAAVGGANITAIGLSRGPYSAATSSLFVGTSNGKLFRLDNPIGVPTAMPVNITGTAPGAAFPAAYISSISVNPTDDSTVLVTFSNYGVTSVFWTGNANDAVPMWTPVEGALTLPSYRSSAIVDTGAGGLQYFVGTSAGLYNTGGLPGAPAWTQEGSAEMGNAVTSNLDLRASDKTLLVGTHGYGMWSANLGTVIIPTPTPSPSPSPTASPTLGIYPNMTVLLSGNTTVTPDVTPSHTTKINVSTSTNFKGLLEGNPMNPAAGVVRVTNAHPAGDHVVTVTASNHGIVTATRTFTLTVTTPPTCNPLIFSGAANIAVGQNPRSVAIGDFNRDDVQDLAVALTVNTVAVLLGTPTGGFGPPVTQGFAGIVPNSMVAGDFNGDGKQDLATVNSGGGDVSILLGNGDGTFTPAVPQLIQTGPLPRTIRVGDFNNDHKQDLVVTNENQNYVSVLIGNGDGTFSAANNFTVGSFPFAVAVGDFNGDDKPDLAVTRRTPANTVLVLLNTSTGSVVTFGSPTPFTVGEDPQAVTVGNFHPGSIQDLATANTGSDNVSVLTGTGLGGFVLPAATPPVGSGPQSLAVGDFDGDGKQDLVVENGGSDNVSVLFGDGAGNFSAPTNFGAGDLPAEVAVGDFNRDGKQDLVVANYLSNDVSILTRECVPTPTPTPTTTPTPTPTATPTPSPATLINISTRLRVGIGDRVMIAGFIIQGSASKTVLIRAAGPSLTNFGVPDALPNPRLELHDTTNTIGENDNWQTTIIGGVITSDQRVAIEMSSLAPSLPAEAAIIATLPPGNYTAIVNGVDDPNGNTGVGIVEVYDIDRSSGSLLANISTRGFVQIESNVMIGGFVIVGQPKRVIIRAIGPSLTAVNVPDALADPQLELYDATTTMIAQNNNWGTTIIGGIITTSQVTAIGLSGLAPLSLESVIIADLPPGSYTAIVRGVGNGMGNGLVEVYLRP